MKPKTFKVATYYYNRELEITKYMKELLEKNGFSKKNLYEKVHIIIGLIDNLCHEIIYHKHNDMNLDIMIDIVIDSIKNMFKSDLKYNET